MITHTSPLERADVASEVVGFVEGDEFLWWALCCNTWRGAWRGAKTTAGVKRHTTPVQLSQSFQYGLSRSMHVATAAAHAGRADLLDMAAGMYGCPVGPSTYCGAASSGQLHILMYLWENYPVDQSDCSVCAVAAGGGHLHCLKFLRYKGFGVNLITCCMAAQSGSTETVVYLIETGGTTREEGMVPLLHYAAVSGNITMLEWLVEKFEYLTDCNDTIARGAIEGSNIEILEWVRENNFYSRVGLAGDLLPLCSWNLTLWRQAAFVGDVRILEWGWAFARGVETPNLEHITVVEWATMGGGLSSVQWLMDKGFALGNAWMVAVQFRHFHIVDFLRSVGHAS